MKKSDDFQDLTLAQYNLKKSYFWLKNMKKSVVWWKESIINTSYETFIEHSAHCGRLWVVEVSCQVQASLAAKLINIFSWKLHFIQLK